MPNDETSQNVPPAPRPYKIDLDAPTPAAAQKPSPWRLLQSSFRQLPGLHWLITANLVVFALMVISSGGEAFLMPSAKTLVDFGCDYGPLTVENGEYWRLLTCMFVHIGALHLGMNMYVLWNVGNSMERIYGTSKFIVIYLVAGLVASLLSVGLKPNIYSAGASGAVFGAFGALLAIFRAHYKDFNPQFIQPATRSIVFLVIYNLIWGFSQKNIDNAAHIGGFIGGVFCGLALLPRKLGEHRWTKRNVIALILLLLGVAGGAKIAL